MFQQYQLCFKQKFKRTKHAPSTQGTEGYSSNYSYTLLFSCVQRFNQLFDQLFHNGLNSYIDRCYALEYEVDFLNLN